MSQLDQFKDSNGNWLTGESLYIILGLVLLTMLIIWGLPRLTKVVPASLVAILVIFGLVAFYDIDTKTVGDIASIKGGFPPFNIPDISYTWETFILILPYAVIVAGVGLIESLLTLNIVDEITETRGQSNRESMAQGVANMLSGLFSGMGGCAMLGQSLINVSNGARAKLSGIVASIMLLSFVLFGSSLIEQLPMAALTGLMIMVAIGTFEWASLKTFNKFPASDIIVMLIVTLVTVFLHNLALAVLIGVIIAALVFAWENSKRIRARKFVDDKGIKHYEIFGPLFFASTSVFDSKFDAANDPDKIIIDFTESRVVDMSAIEALNKLTERYHKNGKKVFIKNLSSSSHRKLIKADKIININIIGKPREPSVIEN